MFFVVSTKSLSRGIQNWATEWPGEDWERSPTLAQISHNVCGENGPALNKS